MPTYCCVPSRNEKGGHLFPKEASLSKKWVKAIRRGSSQQKYKELKPSKSSVVCDKHFLPSDYSTVTFHGAAPKKKHLKDNAVPSVFTWSKNSDECRLERLIERNTKKEMENVIGSGDTEDNSCNASDVDVECEYEHVAHEECVSISPTTAVCEDTVDDAECSSFNINEKTNSFTQTSTFPILSVERFMFDDAGMLFYTGISTYSDFMYVPASLGEAAYHLNYLYNRVENLSVENQCFLTLFKFRQPKTNFELSRLFNISETSVANIWITWTNFMSLQWRELDIWPERNLVSYFCPSDFKRQFPSTRVIIDGTECPIKKPKPPIAQQSTYSTYKNRNTVKVLVDATQGGLVSNLSPAYGGSTSDRQIVERSNLIAACDPGDSIMADKGFNVQDLFATRDIKINIPTFFRKKNRMSGEIVLRDRKISSKRVHIERIIGLAKTYKILKSPLNSTETKLGSEITFICFMLCNFRKCIVSRNA